MEMKTTAIVLAGGSGSRMKSKVKKQYLLLQGKPLLYYALSAFQNCRRIDEIILVCGKEEMEQCRTEIVEQYGFNKVVRITEGGKERSDSVYNGLKEIRDCEYVLIHDGARPFVDEEILNRIIDELNRGNSCVAAMPVKDTIKMSDENGFVEQTPAREKLWSVQTPQAFPYPAIRTAYDRLEAERENRIKVTDDAMVAEHFLGIPIKLVEGSYENLKITTAEDLVLAERILEKHRIEGIV